MNKDKIVLKNETAVELEAAASLENMKAVFEDMTAVDQFWKRCTDENMSEVRILNGEGLTVGAYKDKCLMSPAFTLDKTEDGKIMATFGIRELTDIEKLQAQVSANTETLAVHDGAIGDMGAVMSAMADQEGVTS